MERTRTRIWVERRIAADPTSTALLLAGPTALELWPGVRRLGEVGGRALVEATLAPPADWPPTGWRPADRSLTAATVTARPPRRTPTAFVTRFAWTGPDLPLTDGVLTLSYAPGQGGPTTRAELALEAVDLAQSRLDDQALTAMARAFLENLARAAESRRAA